MSSPTTSMKGETRNQPRKRKESNDDQPLFLKKAFVMISTCPSDIACWSEDGKSFIVKDSERLASEIIPTVYKHNKFSSFVRQLNLYGFRKVRSDSLSNTSDWWVFKHPQFRRDDENALSKIKKSSHFVEPPPNCKDEAAEMKNQMANLNSRIVELDNVVAYLINTLQQQTLVQQQQQQQQMMMPIQVNTNNNQNTFSQQQPESPLSNATVVPEASSSNYQQPQYQLQGVLDNDHHGNITHDKKRKIKATAGGGESPRVNNTEQQVQQAFVNSNSVFNNNTNNTRGLQPLSPISSVQPQQSTSQQQVSQFASNNNYVNGYAINTFTPSNYSVSQPELYRHNATSASDTAAATNAYYGDDDDDEEDEIDDDFDFDGLFDATADDNNDHEGVAETDVYDYDNINMKTVPVAVLHNASNNSSNNSMNIDMDHHHHVLSAAAVAVNATASIVPGIDNNRSPHSVTMVSSIDTDNTSHLSGHSASASTKTNQLYASGESNRKVDDNKRATAALNNNYSSKDGGVAVDGSDIKSTNGPLGISNISEIMQVLPKHLQERFIDQLALSIGQNVLSMPLSGGGFDDNIMAGKCSQNVINSVTAELDWQVKNASVDKCPKAHQQMESTHFFKQQLQNDSSPTSSATTTTTDVMAGSDNDDPAVVGGMITMNSAVINKKTVTIGEHEITSMGVTTLEEHCPLVALGALLASVRLSTSEATESAVQVFSKSCSNFKEKISKLSNLPAVGATSLSTKMLLPAPPATSPRMKGDDKNISHRELPVEEDISIYSL